MTPLHTRPRTGFYSICVFERFTPQGLEHVVPKWGWKQPAMFQQINRCGLITKALFYPIRRITELHVGQKCCRTLTDIKLSFGKARQSITSA